LARKSKKQKASRRARLRALGRRTKKRVSKGVGSQWGKISKLAGVGVFLSQVTQKDRETGMYGGLSKGEQAKLAVNNILGRVLGVNPFSDMQSFEQTMNLDGIFNKWTGLGIGLWLFGKIPIKGIPHKGKASVLGKNIAVGGIVGGFFDAPDGNKTTSHTTIRTPARRMTSSNVITVSTI